MQITLEDVARRLLPSVKMGRALAHSEWLTLVNVAEVLLEGAPSGTLPEDAADNVEKFLVDGQSRRAWRVRVLLHLIEVSSLATHARMFSALSRQQRRELVEQKWIGGEHIWRVCSKVRNLVIFGAYGDRRAAAVTGYVPVPLRPRFQKPRASTRASEAS